MVFLLLSCGKVHSDCGITGEFKPEKIIIWRLTQKLIEIFINFFVDRECLCSKKRSSKICLDEIVELRPDVRDGEIFKSQAWRW